MKAAAIYVRISRDDEDNGLGVERQEKECRALVKQRGWEVADVYRENDTSAFSGTRKEWLRLLDDVRTGKVAAVIAWANDRLYRRVRDQVDLMEALAKAKGTIATVKDGEIDLASGSGRAVMGILANVAAMESDRKSERLVAKHLELAEAGLWMGGRRPFGYRVVKVDGGKSLEVVPSEADAIRSAAGSILDGATLVSIVRSWNAAGLKTTWGNAWEPKPVKDLLTSPTVAGLREHRGEVVGRATWAAVLDRRTWNRVRAEFERRAEGNRRPTGRKYLLTGFLVCGTCGEHLVGHGGGDPRKRSYICRSELSHPTGGRPRIRADKVESYVWDLARDRSASVTEVRDPSTVEGQAELDELEDRLGMLADMLAGGDMTREEYARAARKVRDRRDRVEAKVSKRATKTIRSGRFEVPTFTKGGKHYADLDVIVEVVSKRQHLELVLESAEVKPSGRNAHLPIADRIEIAWRR